MGWMYESDVAASDGRCVNGDKIYFLPDGYNMYMNTSHRPKSTNSCEIVPHLTIVMLETSHGSAVFHRRSCTIRKPVVNNHDSLKSAWFESS